MDPKAKMWFGFVVAFVFIGLVLFLSAGTLDYWQAWAYLAVCAGASLLPTVAIVRDPILLESRTKGGPAAEQRPI